MAAVELTGENFDRVVDRAKIMVIGFFADRCGPCRCVPGFDRAALDHGEIQFGRVDARQQLALGERFGIAANPTVLVVRDGAVVASHAGPLSDEGLAELIENATAEPERAPPNLERAPVVRPDQQAIRPAGQPAPVWRPSPAPAVARSAATEATDPAQHPAGPAFGVAARPAQG